MAVKSAFLDQSLVQPNAKTMLEQLVQYDVIHFAGHGMFDHVDPFNSSLILQESKGVVEKAEKLTVRQISQTNLKRARIAYLSACSTAENRAEALADEVIHLASGFQVAGFSHVIASMWSTDDEVCVKMARGFYRRLKDGSAVQAHNSAVAAAVHRSIMEIRMEWRRYPLLWAPYVHLGA
jgi:CHAT domain-containing protein